MLFKKKKQSINSIPRRKVLNYGPKITRNYTKKYTQKEWSRFSPDIQEQLTNRYNIIITDYKTRNQKIKEFGGKVSKGLASMEMSQTKGNKRISYLDQPINIRSPDTLGLFDKGFGKKKKGYFGSLSSF